MESKLNKIIFPSPEPFRQKDASGWVCGFLTYYLNSNAVPSCRFCLPGSLFTFSGSRKMRKKKKKVRPRKRPSEKKIFLPFTSRISWKKKFPASIFLPPASLLSTQKKL
uniref:Uncharacterized protein n=1 Tax=Ditylum brightwellii TaxID=49249 RepID=A0A7S4VIV5_9STRA